MSEDPSIYLPRQLRPRQLASDSQDATGHALVPRRVVEMPSANETPRMCRPTLSNNSIHINTTDTLAEAISISGMLSRQICALQRSKRSSVFSTDPQICAFLLGYIESDGTVYLNQLDQGIVHERKRWPTAVSGTDIAVPLFTGASKSQFYSCIIRPGYMYRIAGWIDSNGAIGDAGMVLEFVNMGFDIRASALTAPSVDIDNLPSLLAHIFKEQSRDLSSSYGRLRWQDHKSCYSHETGPLAPPEDAVWVNVANDSQNSAVKDAFIGAGAPWSLRVVQIDSKTEDHRTAVVRHTTVMTTRSEYRLAIRLASIEIVGTSHCATSTARLLSFLQYGQGASETISAISLRMGVSLVEPGAMQIPSESSRKSLSRHRPSPKLEQIAAATQALVCVTPSTVARTERRAAVPAVTASSNANDNGNGNGNGNHMKELLEEQRSIRRLLEEQNSLMRAHMTQTQELMRLSQQQPSPQTITRRYLRMKGTHTPIAPSGRLNQPILKAIDESGEAKAAVRRSSSLSEIVEDIRSFEVEGYEETEHVAGYTSRRPLSFATPLCANHSEVSYTESIDDRLLMAGGGHVVGTGIGRIASSSSPSNGITGLVSRINNLVSDSKDAASHRHKPSERPPAIPASAKPPPGCTMPRRFKVTPTTQKYLDSLSQQQQQK
ncbi:hypothetical protein IWW45_003563 [Coemansia sp. RSA 485]|nr:hypothetical protein IWW45_003563 [Coemansia sp. RSA 485]